jgi:hypothetical protein
MQWLDTKGVTTLFSYILQAIAVVAYVGLLFYFIGNALDGGGLGYVIGAVVMTVTTVAIIIGAVDQDEKRGPCVKYETQWSYNSATKSNMPYRVCVERGEWINNG